MTEPWIVSFDEIGMADVARVGGKNASLGEMIRALTGLGVRVPPGFATTADAYRDFLRSAGLVERIDRALDGLDPGDLAALEEAAAGIRQMIEQAPLPEALSDSIRRAYAALGEGEVAVAVRSSATAEDLPEASFAGQQETFLNVRGIDDLLTAVRKAFASLFGARAIVYRHEHGFGQADIALSAGIQKMVRADLGASGVAFTLETESGFDRVVSIAAAWGLGETVVQGLVDPDEYLVYKPALAGDRPSVLSRELGNKQRKMILAESGAPTRVVPVPAADRARFALADREIEHLAAQAVLIEQHYGRPMDIEWAMDGEDGELYILQARPETVHSRADRNRIERHRVRNPPPPLLSGHAVGRRVGSGVARIIDHPDQASRLGDGDVLVAQRTDPDWGPVIRRASAIVTDHGGRACHAAIVAREAGIPALVGCGRATEVLEDGAVVSVSCAEGETGHVYPGRVDVDVEYIEIDRMPEIPVRIMMNLANPHQAFELSRLPNHGVGLARTEFIINRMIGIHPRAALEWETLPDETRRAVLERTAAYPTPRDFYVQRLAEGIAMLAAAFDPDPVIVRTSDFKSNEYAHLLGGELYEPEEENPMLGYRGAARYVSPGFRACFELECEAIRHVRSGMGLTNVEVMIPFLRTLKEAEAVTALLADNGLVRGEEGLRLIMMCEIPSNVLLADEFLEYFDGFSIGSNDLTQLTLGVDRDSDLLAHLFDERDPAVLKLMERAIEVCRARGRYVGICGQGPSDHPDLARWLMDRGIDSLSLNPDSIVETWRSIAGQTGEMSGKG